MNKEQKLILAIHNDFDSAQDRLLQQARAFLNSAALPQISQSEMVAERLINLGFKNDSQVKEAEHLRKQRIEKTEQIVKTQEEAELIEYYKREYPFLKFLTENELDKICKKYGLVYAPVGNYIKDVPEKNIKEIEVAQAVKYGDGRKNMFYVKYEVYDWSTSGGYRNEFVMPNEVKGIWQNPIVIESDRKIQTFTVSDYLSKKYSPKKKIYIDTITVTETNRQGLFICAPESNFDTAKLKKKGLGFFDFTVTEIKDPIVFRYVRGGIQVLSKWGLEASDEMLLNPINN